ncbi:hypothetical protein ACTXT7_000499 [Hymenolepis weldensis]
MEYRSEDSDSIRVCIAFGQANSSRSGDCINAQHERGYLHDLASLQLFIYLFAPVLERLKCEDFETLKLESGLRLWAPLMLFRQPYEGSFPVSVKTPLGQYDEELNVNPLKSYVDQFGPLPEIFQRPGEGLSEEGEFGGLEVVSQKPVPHSTVPFYPTSPNLKIPNAESSDEDSAWYDRHSIPMGSSAAKQSENRPVVPMATLNDICPVSLKDTDSEETESNTSNSIADRNHLEQTLEEQMEILTQTVVKELMATDTVLASHCDLAVMRCLFSPEWSEAGAVWALRYLERRVALLRYERQRQRAEANVQSRFQRLRATLPEAYFAAADTVTGQAIDFGVLRSLSMPHLTPSQRHHPPSANSMSTATLTTPGNNSAGSRGSREPELEGQDRFSAAGRRKIFTVGGGACVDEKQSNSLSQKSSSSDQQSNITTATEGQTVSASVTPTGHSSETVSVPSELHRHFSHTVDTLADTTAVSSTMPSGALYKRKQNVKSSIDSGSSRAGKKIGQASGIEEYEKIPIKDEGGGSDVSEDINEIQLHTNSGFILLSTVKLKRMVHYVMLRDLLDESTLSKPLSDESILGEPSGFLTVPPTDAKQMDSSTGGILRRSNRAPMSPKSAVDLIDLRDDRITVPSTKSQTSLNEARFFGSDVTMNLEDATDSQNSIDAVSTTFDISGGHLLHRCHSDTNISYNSIQQFDEVTGSNQYVKRNGQINCDTLLRGLYWVCNLQSSLRVCEHLLKNIYCLIDLCNLTWDKPKLKKQSKSRHSFRQAHEDSTHSSATRLNAPTSRRNYARYGSTARSKSVAISGLHTGGRSFQLRSRGSSIITHEDSGSVEKLVKVTSTGRLIPFSRTRNRRQTQLGDSGERSGDISSEDENSTTRSIRGHHGRSTNPRKSDRYLNVDCNASIQVRFQPRLQTPSRQSTNYSFRRGTEIPASGPMRVLPNRVRVVNKRPQRKPMLSEYVIPPQEKTPAMLAEEQQQATINFSLIVEILVKQIRILGCSYGHANVCGGGGGGFRSSTYGLGGHLGDPPDALPAMLRRHTHECLLRMFHINKNLFYCFFSRYIACVPITELMEFLHGLTSFCLDPVVLNPVRPVYIYKAEK